MPSLSSHVIPREVWDGCSRHLIIPPWFVMQFPMGTTVVRSLWWVLAGHADYRPLVAGTGAMIRQRGLSTWSTGVVRVLGGLQSPGADKREARART